jgi:1-deoxy-D-xylulose-5-phosphate reductoisomerase
VSIFADVAKRRIALLGATGSIGQSTLKLLRLHPDRFVLVGVSAHRNLQALAEVIVEFQPQIAVVADAESVHQLRELLANRAPGCQLEFGPEALNALSASPAIDTVVAAIVGAAGLPSTFAAARAGKRILLANKESLVIAGELLMIEAAQHQALILPIDSEHNALFQCLPGGKPDGGVKNLWLTASGGPFRSFSAQELLEVTPDQALKHPNWKMGKKISVDSATLMNKGLEVIEARWLFGLTAEQIKVVVHPQSIVHSMVEYIDGSFLAQLGSPDMCTPIAYALDYPNRIKAGVQALNPLQLANLSFEAPDLQRFPCLDLAYQALQLGASASAVLNAANEIAVEHFLNKQLPFQDIARLINACLQRSELHSLTDISSVLRADAQTRKLALELLQASF